MLTINKFNKSNNRKSSLCGQIENTHNDRPSRSYVPRRSLSSSGSSLNIILSFVALVLVTASDSARPCECSSNAVCTSWCYRRCCCCCWWWPGVLQNHIHLFANYVWSWAVPARSQPTSQLDLYGDSSLVNGKEILYNFSKLSHPVPAAGAWPICVCVFEIFQKV